MTRRSRSVALPLALLYAALIVYASLFPFSGWRDQGIVPWAYLRAPWPRYWTGFDLATNLIGYLPLGLLLTLVFERRWGRWRAVVLASLAAALLSFGMESLQSWLPQRVASNVDLGLNAAGGLLGALAAALLARLGLVERLRRLQKRWFVRDAQGSLVLLALWPIGLLFPPPIAFGMGQVYERLEEGLARLLQDTPFLEWLPLREIEFEPLLPGAEIACVALGAAVPCLLAYTVLEPRRRRVLFALLALGAGVAVSALSTALTYGPAHAWAWVTTPVRWGLPLVVLAVLAAARLPRRACVVLLIATLLAQLLLLNVAPQNPYYASALQTWEQGRFIHFFGLAQWVGWLWPFATLAHLLARLRPPAAMPRIQS